MYKQTEAGRAGKDKSPCKLHHRENLSKYSLYFLLVLSALLANTSAGICFASSAKVE
jgi:hypothetical protein